MELVFITQMYRDAGQQTTKFNILPAASSLTLSAPTCHVLPHAAIICTHVSTASHAGNMSNHGRQFKYKKVYKYLYKSQDTSVTKQFLCCILQKIVALLNNTIQTVAVEFKLALKVCTNCNRWKNGKCSVCNKYLCLTTVKPSFVTCLCHHIRNLCIQLPKMDHLISPCGQWDTHVKKLLCHVTNFNKVLHHSLEIPESSGMIGLQYTPI